MPQKIKTAVVFLLMVLIGFIITGCSTQSAAPDGSGMAGRFSRAERFGQFTEVNRSVDCQGTTVTIEKVLLDKTGTFMIAAVEGDISGKFDPLYVKLFDGEDRNLGFCSFMQEYPAKLPGGETLLTFDPVESPNEPLRLEFSGGPVQHENGPVVLDLQDIKLKKVDNKYVRTYQLAELVEKNGFSLLVDAITSGVSETQVHYRLAARGDYDGVVHGWLNNWDNHPAGDTPAMFDGGRKLESHLSGIDYLGPSYKYSLDGKTAVGRANFDALETREERLNLTDVYSYYSMDQIIPLEKITDKISINKKIPVKDYTVCLNSLVKEDDETRSLEYVVLDSAGNSVDAVIDACVYTCSHDYRMPLTYFRQFKGTPGGGRGLVMGWPPGESEAEILEQKPVIKITRLGFRQEDAVLDINLDSPSKSPDDHEEKAVMAAVNNYYKILGGALAKDDQFAFEREYGYLEPTSEWRDGINGWRRLFDAWRTLGVKKYDVSFKEPIVTIAGNNATAELEVAETILRKGDKETEPPHFYNYLALKKGEKSARTFSVVFCLEKEQNKWKIAKVDELTIFEEMQGVNSFLGGKLPP